MTWKWRTGMIEMDALTRRRTGDDQAKDGICGAVKHRRTLVAMVVAVVAMVIGGMATRAGADHSPEAPQAPAVAVEASR